MDRAITVAVGCGVLSALLYLSGLGGPAFLLVQYVTQLPLLAAGLSLGLGPVVVAGAVASSLALLSDLLSGAIFLVGYAVPAVFVVRQALLSRIASDGTTEWYPPGPLLAQITGYAGALLVLAALVLSGQEGGIEGAVLRFIEQTMTEMSGEPPPAELLAMLGSYGFLVPALIGVSWICMLVVNGALAQGLVSGLKRNIRPAPPFAGLRLPDWPAYVVALAALMWLAGSGTVSFVGGALFVIGLAPYFVQGLAVVHAFSRATPSGLIVLLVFYVLLVLLQWPMVIVAALGVVEQWAHLRRWATPA